MSTLTATPPATPKAAAAKKKKPAGEKAVQKNQLTPQEQAHLITLEKTIAEGLRRSIAVGQALRVIRDDKLYRGTHKTFAEYARARFGVGLRYCQCLIAASVIRGELIADLPGKQPPQQETHVRALAGLDRQARAVVWEAVLTEAQQAGTQPDELQILRLTKAHKNAGLAGNAPAPAPKPQDKPVLRRYGDVRVDSGKLLICDPAHIAEGKFDTQIAAAHRAEWYEDAAGGRYAWAEARSPLHPENTRFFVSFALPLEEGTSPNERIAAGEWKRCCSSEADGLSMLDCDRTLAQGGTQVTGGADAAAVVTKLRGLTTSKTYPIFAVHQGGKLKELRIILA